MKNLYSKIRFVLASGLVALIALTCPNNVNAQYYGQSNKSPVVVIDKKIGFSGDKNYYDNVLSSVKTFIEGDQIVFKIVVENKGNQKLTDLIVKDTLPKYLSLLMYPGILNKDTNTIEAKIDSLEVGESKELIIIARISNLPTKINLNTNLELTNKVCVANNQVSDCDNAKYFVAYKSVPATGANDLLVKTISVVSLGLVSVALRKRARGF